jgi:hypothetical protein
MHETCLVIDPPVVSSAAQVQIEQRVRRATDFDALV